MREITSHHTNVCNQCIAIDADERDPDNGASHQYQVRLTPGPGRPMVQPMVFALTFQHGPIGEVGINGITNEALLAILIDRMEGLATGKYACRENSVALTKLQEAAHWLEHRTKARTARGVEGTHKL